MQLRTLRRDDFLQRAATDGRANAFLDDRRQSLLGDVFVRAHGAIVLSRIDDAPIHEVVDDEVLLLAGEEALARVLVVDQDAVRIPGRRSRRMES